MEVIKMMVELTLAREKFQEEKANLSSPDLD